MPQLAVYIETQEPIDHDAIRQFLLDHDNKALDIRDVSVNQEGIIITDFLLGGNWDYGTGQAECDSTCAETDHEHVEWNDLSASQQQEFANGVARFAGNALHDQFNVVDAMLDSDEFGGIALTRCDV